MKEIEASAGWLIGVAALGRVVSGCPVSCSVNLGGH